ncbi:hypothetical protein C8A05DRAFT_17636 [Staphylotrichum tortipilum]|uniref:Uncharacterized protein n=1 Tax=Staphylotrichum tortipilum TaxID=2831512 RepID=A0AAN6RS02_9PEZI|nr:hypothetical protein C8A05DRAFT_17636 [Staphylotrichum longicolle]
MADAWDTRHRADTASPGLWDGCDWYYMRRENLVHSLPAHNPWSAKVGTPSRPYSFWTTGATLFKGKAEGKPHTGAAVVDAAEPGEGEVLRSEVAAGIGLLNLPVHRWDFRQHHTLPALVFSFHHDRTGRITQFHFDCGSMSLTMRQSRLLDFWSHEPTMDAYHMMRWMANRPIGDTEYGTAEDEAGDLGFWDASGANNGKLPVGIREV